MRGSHRPRAAALRNDGDTGRVKRHPLYCHGPSIWEHDPPRPTMLSVAEKGRTGGGRVHSDLMCPPGQWLERAQTWVVSAGEQPCGGDEPITCARGARLPAPWPWTTARVHAPRHLPAS